MVGIDGDGWSWDTVTETWGAMGGLIGYSGGEWSWGNAGEAWGGMLKGMVAWDMWGEDPARAAGAAVFNVASFAIPAAGAIAKLGGAGRGGRLAAGLTQATRISELMDPVNLAVKGGRLAAPSIKTLLSGLDDALRGLRTGIDVPDVPDVRQPDLDAPDVPDYDAPHEPDATPPVRDPDVTPTPASTAEAPGDGRAPEDVRAPEEALVGAGAPAHAPSGADGPGGTGGRGGDAVPGGTANGVDNRVQTPAQAPTTTPRGTDTPTGGSHTDPSTGGSHTDPSAGVPHGPTGPTPPGVVDDLAPTTPTDDLPTTPADDLAPDGDPAAGAVGRLSDAEESPPGYDQTPSPQGGDATPWRPVSVAEIIGDQPVLRDGSHLRPDGSLEPNVWYQTGEHEYFYHTDANGHSDRWITEDLQLKTHDGRLPHDPNTPGKLPGDHAGHLTACSAGHPSSTTWCLSCRTSTSVCTGRVENEWARALRSDPPGSVSVDVRIETDPVTGRPSQFHIRSVINGQLNTRSIAN